MSYSVEAVLDRLAEKFPKPNGRELFPEIENVTDFVNNFTNGQEKALVANVMARMEVTMNAHFNRAIREEYDASNFGK